MIKSIKLKNFQSHKSTTLKLDKGINVIVGSSDSGKSSIRRAIQWVRKNRPTGTSMINHKGGTCTVRLSMLDGVAVKRIRGRTSNCYRLNGQKLMAMGTGSPEPVQKVLALDEINFQTQTDPPFMISESPIEVARMINRAADLWKIDTTQQNMAGRKREVEAEVKEIEHQLDQLHFELKPLKILKQQRKDFQKIEAKETKLRSILNQVESLTAGIELLEQLTTKIQIKQKVFKQKEEVIRHLSELANAEEKTARRFGSMKYVVQDLIKLKEEIEEKEQLLKELQKKTKIKLCPTCGKPL